MANYQEAKVEIRNTQLNELKFVAKSNRNNIKKNFEVEELPHLLFLATGETTKIRYAFGNNASTDMKVSKAQISKIIQSGGSFASWLGDLGKKR